MFFADLRGSTNFVDAVEPKELMRVLDEADAETRAQKGDLFDDSWQPRELVGVETTLMADRRDRGGADGNA